MNPMTSKSNSLYWLLGVAAILIMACDSAKPTRFASAEPVPKFLAKVEVVLGDNDPPSKSDYTSGNMGSGTNFKYKVEIEIKYTAADPFGAAKAYAVVDGDTIFTSSQDWIASPGSNHAVSLFAFASHGASRGNPANASAKIQCQWD